MKVTWVVRTSALLLALHFFAIDAVIGAEDEGSVSLFNGKDLTGWTPYLWNSREGKVDTTTPMDAVWTVQDGVLTCQGRPVGYLRSNKEFANYKLQLQWRWPAETERANSGVLVHVSTPNALGLWPKSVEVQLYTRNAGDFWVIGTTLNVTNLKERKKGRRYVNLTNDSERPIGQWNQMEIICQKDEIKVFVNRNLVNHATECSDTRGGAIALQSEGRPIEFRDIRLTPLK